MDCATVGKEKKPTPINVYAQPVFAQPSVEKPSIPFDRNDVNVVMATILTHCPSLLFRTLSSSRELFLFLTNAKSHLLNGNKFGVIFILFFYFLQLKLQRLHTGSGDGGRGVKKFFAAFGLHEQLTRKRREGIIN